MNDLSMLAPEETLALKLEWGCGPSDMIVLKPGDPVPKPWTVARCIPCLLTRGVQEAWTWHNFRDARLPDLTGNETHVITVNVVRKDFYKHLVEVHEFPTEFAVEAARRLK